MSTEDNTETNIEEDKETATKKNIEAAIRALRLLPMAEKKIPVVIKNIVLVSGLAKSNDFHRAKPCSKEKADMEISKFLKLATDLYKHLGSMHRTSLEKFEIKGVPHPLALQDHLMPLIKIALKKDYVPLTVIDNPPKKDGAPKKMQAKMLVKYLASIFEELTGKKPRRTNKKEAVNYNIHQKECGEFLEFVESIRKTLGLKFSSNAQVIEWVRQSNKKVVKKGH